MKKKLLIAVATVAVLVTAVFLLRIFSATKGEVDLRNDAHENIIGGEVSVCGQRFDLGKIQPRGVKHIDYKINCEGHYTLTTRFESGRTLSKDVGYVTTSFDFHDSIAIKQDDVVLERIELK